MRISNIQKASLCESSNSISILQNELLHVSVDLGYRLVSGKHPLEQSSTSGCHLRIPCDHYKMITRISKRDISRRGSGSDLQVNFCYYYDEPEALLQLSACSDSLSFFFATKF